ncbi:MAG: TIGR01777 family oxidoreductase [Verrucomicrobiota bacterium]
MKKIVIAGGSGFLGQTLAQWFLSRGDQVIILTRKKRKGLLGESVLWDGINEGSWFTCLERADALINLAGRSVNCRYHPSNRREIMESRTRSTQILGKAVQRCKAPPRLWLQSSTATIYLHRHDQANDEAFGIVGAHADAKDAFSVEVAKAWENAFNTLQVPSTRKILLRTAMVFGEQPGGVYHVLRRLVRFGLGGSMDGGQQWVSWIHAEDVCRALDWMIEKEKATGIYNLCAPVPLRNVEMMSWMRQICRAPLGFGLPHPRFILELGAILIRTETELVIKSRNVVPKRLLNEGFRFRFETFDSMLRDIEKTL